MGRRARVACMASIAGLAGCHGLRSEANETPAHVVAHDAGGWPIDAADGADAAPVASGAPAGGSEARNAAATGGAADAGASRACPATPWSCYAHDAARTSASEGCVDGALAQTWSLTRKGGCGFRARAGKILHVVAEEGALFAAVDCGDSPAVMRVTPQGEPLWTFSRGDYGRGTWPALAGDAVLSTDDGVFFVDRETGTRRGHELDVWGEPLAADGAFFVDNTFQLDSAGPFVGSFDGAPHWLWRASNINPGKGKAVPRTGGVAYADGLVVHAAAMGAHTVPSLSAHDAKTGEVRWRASGTWPESAPSIAASRVYDVERWQREKNDRLVARGLTDGAVVWSQEIPWARGPSPAVGGGFVLVHARDAILAFDAATGTPAWSAPIRREAPFVESVTTVALAGGSKTAVVTSGADVVVLDLRSGAERARLRIGPSWEARPLRSAGAESPVIVGRTVYVTRDGVLYRLDPAT